MLRRLRQVAYSRVVTWAQEYLFREPLVDLREDPAQADVFAAELRREVAPGHPLAGRAWRVIARALPNDDIVIESGDAVAVVHLTWIQKQDRPPWPRTTFVTSVEEFGSYVRSEFDCEP